ncbi:glycosyl transferase [candidate division WOR_3 bacterium SM23_42]|uniref:Glycosyl transferase n=1 Tax=candidate division WOR_3 bacterium SM23_42 TaxID=1703779 RepID=A0A0S8FNP3_UNCW3|nr:MAG: glycosyl transferase [candidate division WOR_3 bacterium SM23_42]
MKLIIQIPCYNEEELLPITLRALPKEIEGIDTIETLVIDDGSSDKTVEVARKNAVTHILSFKHNRGLARAFAAGIEKCLELSADIIVNTDADNQYSGNDIPKLVKPILEGEADIIVGDRQTDKIASFSPIKKMLQKIGSTLVRRLSNARIIDTVSGFRAYSREAAMHINILTEFSYTVENLIQLGNDKFKIQSVPINTNETLRKSKLHRGTTHFVSSQLRTIIRSYAMYKALKVFTYFGLLFLLPGLLIGARFVYFFIFEPGKATGHVQSLIFAAVLIIISFILFMLGIIADLISDNRKLIEKLIQYHRKQG